MKCIKVMLIGDLPRLQSQWDHSRCGESYCLVSSQSMTSVGVVSCQMQELSPDVVVIGDGFGAQPFVGDKLIAALKRCRPSLRIIVDTSGREQFRVPTTEQVNLIMAGSTERGNLRKAIDSLYL